MTPALTLCRIPIALCIGAVLVFANVHAEQEGVTLRVEGRSTATPWVAAADRFVVVAFGGTTDGRTDVFVAVSRDAGRTFAAPVQVNTVSGEARLGGELPPRIALRARLNADPEIVVVWTTRAELTEVKLARSSNGGLSFSAPVTLQAAGAAGDRGWPALTLDPRGTAHVIWLDHRGLAAARTAGTHQHKSAGDADGAMAKQSGLYYRAHGAVDAPERELTAGVCYCCKTAFAATANGGLFAAWRHVYARNMRDIALSMSSDGGRSFSTPVRVSEDRWQLNGCPDDGPAIAAEANGIVHIVWPTVVQGPEPEGALFYSSTRDGRTFTPRLRVPTLGSPKPSHPQVMVQNGRVIIAWDEMLQGTRMAAVREVVWTNGEAAFGEVTMLQPEGSSMYPVGAVTSDGPVIAWTSGSQGQSVVRVRQWSNAQ
jgi:hypothetical protein